MTATLLLEQFEHLIVTPADVEQLNRAILKLAVQGQLVEQDPNDEPAGELIKRIHEEVTHSIKVHPVNNDNSNSEISIDKQPNKLPNSWKWVRLGNLCRLENGDRSKKNYPNKSALVSEGVPFVNAGHLVNGHIDRKTITFITKARFDSLRSGKFKNGDILFCLRGSLGKAALVEGFDAGAIASSLVIVKIHPYLSPQYFLHYFNSPLSSQMIKKYDNGTAQPNLSAAALAKFLIPLPPLAEQKRIVARVEQLFAQTRTLADKLASGERALAALNQSSLAHLLSSETPEEFQKHWDFIAAYFESLFIRPEHVAPLRQSILELAVRGKLTRREPGDESARVMLGRIRKEKKERGMKEVIAPFKESEKPFPLPEGWEWTTLGFISKKIHYGYTESADFTIKNYRLLRITDIQDSKVNWSHVPGCAIDEQEADKYLLHDDDILIARTGGTIGKSYLVKKLEVKAVFASYLIRVQKCNEINANYLKIFLDSPLYWQQLFEKSKGTGQPNVNATSLSQLILPMPSLAEQVRILAQVETLLGLCEALESRLRTAKEERSRLVESVLAGVRS